MQDFLHNVCERLRRNPKRVVFPEGHDSRVVRAAAEYVRQGLGAAVLLGDSQRVQEAAYQAGVSLLRLKVIDPAKAQELTFFSEQVRRYPRFASMDPHDAKTMLCNPNYFGAMMLAYGQVDALVGGASVESSSLLRPLFSIVRTLPGVGVISSCMLLQVEDSLIGDNGLLVLADCGVIPEPTVEQLANIAVEAGQVYWHMTGRQPFVAMLSYSTRGSAKTRQTEKVAAAAALAKKIISENHLQIELDGELQVDAALSPRVAFSKVQGSPVAGRANVLIFPDLNSGNIATKLVQQLARCRAYGQILMGINKPAADVSRGASWQEIFGVAAIVANRAITYRELYPEQGARGLPAIDLQRIRFEL